MDALRSFGWYLSEEGLALCQKACEETNRRNLIEVAMEMDLRSIAKPSLPPDINRKRQHQVEGPLVLQIQKVKNVAVPSSKQHDSSSGKRLLRLQLTDGHAYISAMELEGPIEKLSPDMPPGTKVSINGTVAVVNGFMLLKKSSMEVLGGRVEGLHKKWSSMKAVPDNMDRTKGDGEEGPPQFVKFGKTSSDTTRNSNTSAVAQIKGKSVEPRHQSPTGEVSTREKMELPSSYIQGVGKGWSGEPMKKDPTSYSASFSKDDVKLSSQIRELSLTEPCTLDIENIVQPNWTGKGLGHGDQASIRARRLGSAGEGQSRESGRTRRPPMEDGGRERRGRGRKRRDSEDDYCQQGRKETYLLSEFLERVTQSSGGGGGGGDKEEDVFEDYIYDEQDDQYYLKTNRGSRLDVHFSNDDNFMTSMSNRDTQHDSYPKRVEYNEGSSTDTFIRGSGRMRGRGGSRFRGSQMEWDNQRTSRGGRGGSYEGRYERRGKGRESEGWGKDDSRMKVAGESRNPEVRDGCGSRPLDRKSFRNQGLDNKIRHGGRGTIQSYHHSSTEHCSAHSMTAGEGHYEMAEQETYRGKKGENERQSHGERTRQNRDNYAGSRDDYRSTDWDRLSSTRRGDKRTHGSRRGAATRGEEVTYEMPHHPYDSPPSGSSHWAHLEQLQTVTGVPASAVKGVKKLK